MEVVHKIEEMKCALKIQRLLDPYISIGLEQLVVLGQRYILRHLEGSRAKATRNGRAAVVLVPQVEFK